MVNKDIKSRFSEVFMQHYENLQEDEDVIGSGIAWSALRAAVGELEIDESVAAQMVLDNPHVHALVYGDVQKMNLIRDDGSIEGI